MQPSIDFTAPCAAPLRRRLRMGLATALAAGLLAGCAAGGPHADKIAANARAELGSGHADKAVALAEKAVLSDPRNGAYRLLLGNSYLRAGRFESARQAYDEAMELGEDSGKAALSLALAEIGMGRSNEAVDTLNSYRDAIPVEDYGLALALAGRTGEGIELMGNALRTSGTNPKIRQNLAFALALHGEWKEARVMASFDVPADQLDARIQQWAAIGNPEDVRRRVASLIGAPVREDAGQPTALALANFPETAQLAAAAAAKAETPKAGDAGAAPALAKAAVEELPALDTAPAPRVADASTQPRPAQLAMIDAPAAKTAPVAVIQPQARAYRIAAAAARPSARPAAKPVAMSAAKPAVRPTVAPGTHLVQLGAFSTADGARRAWRHFTSRNPALASYRNVTTQVTVNGRRFWRVQAAGFVGQASAATLCRSVKAHGGACLVMAAPRVAPPQPGRTTDTRLARLR